MNNFFKIEKSHISIYKGCTSCILEIKFKNDGILKSKFKNISILDNFLLFLVNC